MGTAIPPECLVVNADEGNVVEEEGSKRGSLPVHHLNRDFFLCDLFDYALKDDSVSIEAPIFTLATKPTRRSGTGNPTACRCALHHKLFDLGVFTVEPTEYRIVFSQRAISGGRGMSGELQFHGQPIHAPQHTDLRPAPVFLA